MAQGAAAEIMTHMRRFNLAGYSQGQSRSSARRARKGQPVTGLDPVSVTITLPSALVIALVFSLWLRGRS